MADGRAHVFPNGLTSAQARMLRRHEKGIERLSCVLAHQCGVARTQLLLVLAHAGSCLGRAIRRAAAGQVWLPDVVILPGLARELPQWLERLSVSGPVVDCTTGQDGVPVVLIDDEGAMALWRQPLR